jgi:very-short-patch-repair endonuclease
MAVPSGIVPLTLTPGSSPGQALSPEGRGDAGGGGRGRDFSCRETEPLTPTLSPQGRGGDGAESSARTQEPTSPLRGEVDAKRRVRGSVSRARALRHNGTDAERKLWSILRGRQLNGHKFVRQLAIGPFVADFVCREAALIVEADGGQHAENPRDERRTAYLNAEGYSVLRLWNIDILTNSDGVREVVAAVLALDPLPDLRFSPALYRKGRGERGARAATTRQRSYRRNAEPISE